MTLKAPRLPFASLLLPVALLSSSCKEATTPAEQAAAIRDQGRWVAQYRSPNSKQYSGYLGIFSYNSISLVSPDVAVVCGDVPDPTNKNNRVPIVLRTADGGRQWVEVPLPDGLNTDLLASTHFVSPEVGWVVGAKSELEGSGVCLRTTDGGATWSSAKVGFKQTPSSVFFADSQRGWMGGVTGEDEDEEGGPSDILSTTDGGATWFSQRRIPISIADLFFLDADTGWASGYRGAIYRTTDGGLTWDSQRSGLEPAQAALPAGVPAPDPFVITGIHFVDPNRGWASAADDNSGMVIGTTDGGRTWERLLIAQDQRVRDVLFVSPTEGWVTLGTSEFVYHSIDAGHRWEAETITFDERTTLYRLAAVDSSKMWAVGGGAIFTRLVEKGSP